MSILILPDDVIGAIGSYLTLYSANITSRTCRRLHMSLPASLQGRGDSSHIAKPNGEYQLSSIAKWMRVYNFTARVCENRCMSFQQWLVRDEHHIQGRWLQLDLSDTKVTDFCISALGNVHALDLSFTQVTDVGAVALGNVHTLDLSGTRVTDVQMRIFD